MASGTVFQEIWPGADFKSGDFVKAKLRRLYRRPTLRRESFFSARSLSRGTPCLFQQLTSANAKITFLGRRSLFQPETSGDQAILGEKPFSGRYKSRSSHISSYKTLSESQNERFRIAKPAGNPHYRPHTGSFSSFIFGYRFPDGDITRKWGPVSDETVPENGVWICVMTGFHTSSEETSVAMRRQQREYKTQEDASAEEAKFITDVLVLLPLCSATHSHTPRGTITNRWDRTVKVRTTRFSPLYSQSRLRHMPNAQHTLVVNDEDSHRLRHADDVQDRRERRERQPS